jgi:tRNA-Thr(GGU) m(6)t(6)A37 methyltransferase TsaA
MKNDYKINTIGKVVAGDENFIIKIKNEYRPALENLVGFSHLQILWWGNLFDKPKFRKNLSFNKLIKNGPDKLGTFTTRSPVRPNPIMLSIVKVNEIDFEKGIIRTPFIDANDQTPVLDIKPYHLMERVEACEVPDWCADWPRWFEESTDYNWGEKFNIK